MEATEVLQHHMSPADYWAAALASLLKSCYMYHQQRTAYNKQMLQFALLAFLLEDRAVCADFDVPVPVLLSDRAQRLVRLVREYAAEADNRDLDDADFDEALESELLKIGDFGGDASNDDTNLEETDHETH